MLEIVCFVQGPVATNAYLVADSEVNEAVVIDPGWDGEVIFKEAQKRGWLIREIWLSHAHFDHMGGIAGLLKNINPQPEIALHPADVPLWDVQGGADWFGIKLNPLINPTKDLSHGQILKLGNTEFQVRHTPGHSRGHVVFVCSSQGVVFCGDLIFKGSIGRSDLPGGDEQELMKSINQQILTLPDQTRLLPGHGPETTIASEKYLRSYLA